MNAIECDCRCPAIVFGASWIRQGESTHTQVFGLSVAAPIGARNGKIKLPMQMDSFVRSAKYAL
jgi:hypothetical protein